jgi:putative ABC transport system permease protein
VWKVTIKGLLAHKLRLALTAIAIVLGVTFVVGTLVLTDTLQATFDNLFGQVYQHVDLQVRAKAAFDENSFAGASRKSLPESLAATVGAVPGVAVAQGQVNGYAQLVSAKDQAIANGGAPTLGFSWDPHAQLSALKLAAGRPPTGPQDIVIDEGTAQRQHLAIGDKVQVLLKGPTRTFTIVGVARFGTSNNLLGATLASFALPTAQQIFDKVGQYDAISVLAQPGVSQATLQHRIAAVLPPGVEVVTGQTLTNEATSSVSQAVGFLSTALLVFAFIALFVGAFTIFNTFSIIVGQRTRELALLRVVGASRRQLFRSVLGEAAIVGVLASLVGLGLGVLAAVGLEALLKAVGVTLPSGSLVFAARTVVAGLAIGVGVTLLSAIGPARRAVRIPPVAALSDRGAGEGASTGRRLAVGSAVLAVGAVVLAVGLTLPAIQLVGVGALAIFIGIGMMAPVVARPVSSVIGRPLAAAGIAGKLGRGNSMRSPRRTAQTASALMVGLALVATMAVFGASLSRSATASVEQAVRADYIITPANQAQQGFSDSVASLAAQAAPVRAVSSVYTGRFQIEGSVSSLTAVSAADVHRTVILRMDSGSSAGLAGGQLLIDTTTADTKHWKVGTVVPVVFAQTGATHLRIGGIYKPNALLGSYLVGDGTFLAHFSQPLPVAVLLATGGSTGPATTHAVTQALAPVPGLKIQTRAQFEKSQEQQVNQLLGLVYALLALAILIALIGIVNTLMLSVFERTREIGLLRAVGMRRGQVRAMIRAESVIISLFGAVIGVVVGTVLGVVFSESLRQQGITDVVVPWASLVVFLVIAALLGLLAATWPARRAAKLDILGAISSE